MPLKPKKPKPLVHASLQALTAAALALPGLAISPNAVASDDEVSFQYGHYEEGKRDLGGIRSNLKPIQVDSILGSARVKLTDRVKFAFNYLQDTWSGATPISSAPISFGANKVKSAVSGASPILIPTSLTGPNVRLDAQLNPLLPQPVAGRLVPDTQIVQTLSMASPETRKQGDFKLGYEWDEAAVDFGGGISLENDYESRFGNVGGRLDFNQKLTTLNFNLSYTNSDTNALLDHEATPYIYETSNGFAGYAANHTSSQLLKTGSQSNGTVLHGNREDVGVVLGLTQVLNKQAVIETNLGYTNSSGYLANPYKTVTTIFMDPFNQAFSAFGITSASIAALLEKRPDERNQWTAGLRYIQNVEALNGALHLDYQFFHDDWGINAHTFEVNWAQSLDDGWLITPRVRFYSQNAADFFMPYMVSKQALPGKFLGLDKNNKAIISPLDSQKLPQNYSSDQRLSGFGALSGGVTIHKQFAKGVSLEAGAEYYTHAGSLMLGGTGEGAYADFDYYMVNAALKVDLSALSMPSMMHHHGEHHTHDMENKYHHHGSHAPAGVMFDHLLSKAGEFMVGYRYMYGYQGGGIQRGGDGVSDRTIINAGCNGKPCYIAPANMDMSMHMLDLMYAPTDWLTLMLMPQFMDMNMDFRSLTGTPTTSNSQTTAAILHSEHPHNTGGIGDTSAYALFKLYDSPGHHVHGALGFSAPTGDTGIQLRDSHAVNIGFIHYGMQLGSGTWDFKPSLTYTGESDDWSWGVQLSGVKRLESQNSSGFAFGDVFQGTAWGSYGFSNWLSASVRGLYTFQDTNSGAYNGKYIPIGPMDYGSNYGGHYWDMGFGLSATVPTGDLQGNRLSFEWLQPIHDDVNGYQLPREGALSATWNIAF